MLVTIIRTDTSARTFGLVTLYVRLHHGVYISCVFVGVERLSFTRAWRVGRLLCGRVVCCLRAFCAFLSRRKIYIISDIISDMIS